MRTKALLVSGLATVVACVLFTVPSNASMIAQPPLDPALEKLQLRIVNDRDRALRGGLKLGALSDGHFNVSIDAKNKRVVITMPPLRADRLKSTRRQIARRYGEAPVKLVLARQVRPRALRDRATAPRPGKPFICRGETIAVGMPGGASGSTANRRGLPLPADTWNAKRIIGKPLRRAQRMAQRYGCAVRPVLVDGMALAVTMDYRSNRMNVVLRAGRVTQILSIG